MKKIMKLIKEQSRTKENTNDKIVTKLIEIYAKELMIMALEQQKTL